MRISVLSLLRVGDVLMQVHLLRALKQEYPNACITMIVNDGVEGIAPLIPEVDCWKVFPRSMLQTKVGTAEYHLLRPLQDLQNWLFDTFPEPCDMLYNFTHNRLSAYLSGLIPARVRRGLRVNGLRFSAFENRWLRYFNDRFPVGSPCSFHYIDILAGAFDLQINPVLRDPLMSQVDLKKTIYLQTLTSQKTKQKSTQFWIELVNAGKKAIPGTKWIFLGAPFEEDLLRRNYPNLDIAILDWSALSKTWDENSVLVTGDTSVKHLAALQGVQTIEIGVAGVDPGRTGAYGTGHFFLEHAEDKEHIAQIINILNGRPFSDGVSQTHIDDIGFFLQSNPMVGHRQQFWRASWKSYLDGDGSIYSMPVGGEDLRDLVDFFALAEQSIRNMKQTISSWQIESIDKSFLLNQTNSILMEDEFFDLRLLVAVGAASSISYMGAIHNTINNIQERVSFRKNHFCLNQQEKKENDRDRAVFSDSTRATRESNSRDP